MTSDPGPDDQRVQQAPGLFDAVLARGGARSATSDLAWLQALLDVEGALARVQARAGLLPEVAATIITDACDAERFDAAAIGEAASGGGNPVIPLVAALRDAVGHDAADWVHYGATSQDVLDTAAMSVAKAAGREISADLQAAAEQADALAQRHRDTAIAGRTLLQQAAPTSFGLKAAGWLVALEEAGDHLEATMRQRLAVQLGGPVGTLAELGDHGPALVAGLANDLGLVEPRLAWHAHRGRLAALAGALGEVGVAIGKIAGDVVLLAQTEVGEVHEADGDERGGSSSLPHKRNPVAAVAARAAAEQVPGLVANLLGAGGRHEHERAAGAWHAEWRPLNELLRTVGSGAAWLSECLGRLVVDPAQMRANLEASGGLLMVERVAAALAPALGRAAAHRHVRAVTGARGDLLLLEVLAADATVGQHLDRDRLAELLDAGQAVAVAGDLVDRARRDRGREQQT